MANNILFTPNGKLHKYLTLNRFNPFQPFINGQKISGPKRHHNYVNLIDTLNFKKNQSDIELFERLKINHH